MERGEEEKPHSTSATTITTQHGCTTNIPDAGDEAAAACTPAAAPSSAALSSTPLSATAPPATVRPRLHLRTHTESGSYASSAAIATATSPAAAHTGAPVSSAYASASGSSMSPSSSSRMGTGVGPSAGSASDSMSTPTRHKSRRAHLALKATLRLTLSAAIRRNEVQESKIEAGFRNAQLTPTRSAQSQPAVLTTEQAARHLSPTALATSAGAGVNATLATVSPIGTAVGTGVAAVSSPPRGGSRPASPDSPGSAADRDALPAPMRPASRQLTPGHRSAHSAGLAATAAAALMRSASAAAAAASAVSPSSGGAARSVPRSSSPLDGAAPGSKESSPRADDRDPSHPLRVMTSVSPRVGAISPHEARPSMPPRTRSSASGAVSPFSPDASTAAAAATTSPPFKSMADLVKTACSRQKTHSSAPGAGLGLGLGGMHGSPLGVAALPLVDQPLPTLTAAAVSNAAAAVVAASLTDSDSDDPTSGHTRRRFALFDRDDDDEEEEERPSRHHRSRSRSRTLSRTHDRSRSRSRSLPDRGRPSPDSHAHMYDAKDSSVTADRERERERERDRQRERERERERARSRRMLVIPGPKKRSVSFSSLYRALRNHDDYHHNNHAHAAAGGLHTPGEAPSASTSGTTTPALQDGVGRDGGGGGWNGSDLRAQQSFRRRRDPNNLGPRPRKLEAHGRFQLWVVGILHWLAIVLQLCSMWSEDWVEDSVTLLGRRGKDLVQWLLLALALLAGVSSYACLMLRFHGVRWAAPWFKWAAMGGLVVQGGAAIAASELYRTDHDDLVDESLGKLQYGSSYSFAVLSRSYCGICIGLLVWQEIAEYWSRRHAYRLADSLQKLRQLRTDAHTKAVAKVAAAAAAAAAAATPNPDGSLVAPSPDHAAVTAAAAAADAAAYADAETLAGSQQFLSELSKLGVVVSAGRQLNLDALPSPESVLALAATLRADKDYLSRGQRRLVWTSIAFFFVIFGGGMLYASLEGWNARASIDFAIVSLATIGYGNMSPRTSIGRVFMFLYFPVGFAVVGFTVNTLWKVVLIKLDHRFTDVSKWIARKVADRREAEEAVARIQRELEAKIMEERLRIAMEMEERAARRAQAKWLYERSMSSLGEHADDDGDKEGSQLRGPQHYHHNRHRSHVVGHAESSDSDGDDEQLSITIDGAEHHEHKQRSPSHSLTDQAHASTTAPLEQEPEPEQDSTTRAEAALEEEEEEHWRPPSADPDTPLSRPPQPTDATPPPPPPPPPMPPAVPAPADAPDAAASSHSPNASFDPSAPHNDDPAHGALGTGVAAAGDSDGDKLAAIGSSNASVEDVELALNDFSAHPDAYDWYNPYGGVESSGLSSAHPAALDPSSDPLLAEVLYQQWHPDPSASQHTVPPIPLSALSPSTRAAISSAKKARRFGTKKVKLSLAVLFVLIWILFSSVLFAHLEGWSYFTAIWFSFITLSTVGYGDFYTSNSDTSAFFLWFVIFGLGSVTYVLTLLSEIMLESAEQKKEAEAKRKEKLRKRAARRKRADRDQRARARRHHHHNGGEEQHDAYGQHHHYDGPGGGTGGGGGGDGGGAGGAGGGRRVSVIREEEGMDDEALEQELRWHHKQLAEETTDRSRLDPNADANGGAHADPADGGVATTDRKAGSAVGNEQAVRNGDGDGDGDEGDDESDNDSADSESQSRSQSRDANGPHVRASPRSSVSHSSSSQSEPAVPPPPAPLLPRASPRPSVSQLPRIVLPMMSRATSAGVPDAPPLLPPSSSSRLGVPGSQTLQLPLQPLPPPQPQPQSQPQAQPSSSPRPSVLPFGAPLSVQHAQNVLLQSRVESILAVPSSVLLEFAEEFNGKTKELLASARASVQQVNEHAHLFDANKLDAYLASYQSMLRVEEKRAKVFQTAWMRNMMAVTQAEREQQMQQQLAQVQMQAQAQDQSAQQQSPQSASREQMLQQINQIKDFKNYLQTMKAQPQLSQQQQPQSQKQPQKQQQLPPTTQTPPLGPHPSGGTIVRHALALQRPSMQPFAGAPGQGGAPALASVVSAAAAAASRGAPPSGTPVPSRYGAPLPPNPHSLTVPPAPYNLGHSSESETDSDNEDAELDWSVVGDRRRISRLIPMAPPIAPPLAPTPLSRPSQSLASPLPPHLVVSPHSRLASHTGAAAAAAAVASSGKALSPMEAAAAVARALFQARKAKFEVQTAPAPTATPMTATPMAAKTSGAVAAGPVWLPVAITSATASPSVSSNSSSINNRVNINNNHNGNSSSSGHVVEYLAPHDPADDRSRLVHSWASANPRRSSLIVPGHSTAPVAMPPPPRRAPSSPIESTGGSASVSASCSPRSPHGGYPDASPMDRVRAAMAAATPAHAHSVAPAAPAAVAAQSVSSLRGSYSSKRFAGPPREDDEGTRFDRASATSSSSNSSARR